MVAHRLARNARRVRVARGVSLSELGRATGIGKATLSAIENGRANPTLDTLALLATALDIPFGDLLDEHEADDVQVIRGAGEVAVGGVTVRRVRVPARTDDELRPGAAGGREHVLVTRGTLVAGPVEHPTELGAGDYAAYPADVPRLLRTGAREAEAVVLLERV